MTLFAVWLLSLQDPEIRAGMIGLDTSHVGAFTPLLKEQGIKVVVALKGGSPDVQASATRIEGFTKSIQEKHGVEIVGSIEELLKRVDVVLVMSVDGRVHLEQARPVFAAKKRLFIDKPLAACAKDGREIVKLSKETGTPFFSASSLRFVDAVRARKDVGKVLGCDVWCPSPTEPHHPDLFWYGVHGAEIMSAIMGPGCESVRRWHTAETDVVTARWKDGRLATFRGIRQGKSDYGAVVYGDKGIAPTAAMEGGYKNLVAEIVKFFKGGPPPVSVEEMLQVLEFMEAAEVSKQKDGALVRLDELK